MRSNILYDDINNAVNVDFIPWDMLKGRKVFITGATGLIGYSLINVLYRANKSKELGLHVIALVRNIEKAKHRFRNTDTNGNEIEFIEGNIENKIEYKGDIDYIIHGASQTASREFVEHPVETIKTALCGTENILRFALEKRIEGLVYLSSMEVYGYPEKGHKIIENEMGSLSSLDIRNSYPLSKQMCEALCCAYSSEYDVHAKIMRLAQTFGPGINIKDNRIFAYFAECARDNKDIILKTKGETERSYLYSSDAATAIITVLLKGKTGEAYNAADEKTYCSIAEMAEMVAKDYGVSVRYDIQDEETNGFPKTLYMNLDTTKLRNLGWRAKGGHSLSEMYARMINSGVYVYDSL